MQSTASEGRYDRVALIVPCFNEAEAIGPMVRAVRAIGVQTIIVVDGDSSDTTAANAKDAGASVIVEARRGYGLAIQTGLAALPAKTDIVLFMDGDGSDRPEHIPRILEPLLTGRADFVHGTRLQGDREQGALTRPQIIAGHLAGLLILAVYRVRFTDMSPFRAITRAALDRLGMRDNTFGWNLEMQMRAAAAGLFGMQLDEILSLVLMCGMLERHPKLRIVMGESGIGWIPYVLERIEYEIKNYAGMYPELLARTGPRELFHRQVYATFTDEVLGTKMIPEIGVGNVLWAADYPHGDGSYPNSRQVVERHFGVFSERDRRRITGDNARALYRIPASI